MVPSIHDVVGRPLAGSGMAPAPQPGSQVQFRALLDRLLGSGKVGRSARPASGSSRVHESPTAKHVVPAKTQMRFGVGAGATRPAASPRNVIVPRIRPAIRESHTHAPVGKEALKGSIRQASASAGVAPELSVAIARAESSLDPRAVSPDGVSVGTFQVTHATKAEMRKKFATGIVDRPPGNDDVALGVGYLRYLGDTFAHDTTLAPGLETRGVQDAREHRRFVAAAFNAGEGRVASAQAQAAALGLDPTHFANVNRFLPRITQGYVDRVQAYASEESAVDTVG